MTSVLLLELNEVNFEFVEKYTQQGELPTFARLFERHGYSKTTSEQEYEHLEPWIQWVTAHTGQDFKEHRVFRLGDVEGLRDLDQVWERVRRERGVRVGAISPMNARNALAPDGFFVPDPWTKTDVTGPFLLRKMSRAISEMVNNNAEGRVTAGALGWLALSLLANARPRNYFEYLKLAGRGLRDPWPRALLLDLLLADTFTRLVKNHKPGFASLFLNAAAHIQHHYMFSSSAYEGPHRNPEWYLRPGQDPVLEVYRLYDRILLAVMEGFPTYRVMIATALHQDPYEDVAYYWRLRDHAAFLARLDIAFLEVRPRMSRDFSIICRGADESRTAAERLSSLRAPDGAEVFSVERRDSDLFVTLTYPKDIGPGFELTSDHAVVVGDFAADVAFVALKNGKHHGIGYFIDSGAARGRTPAVFALRELPRLIVDAVG